MSTNEYVKVSPESTSNVVTVPTVVSIAEFSGIDPLKFNPKGASLTLLTFIVNVLSKDKPPLSVDLIVTLCELADS